MPKSNFKQITLRRIDQCNKCRKILSAGTPAIARFERAENTILTETYCDELCVSNARRAAYERTLDRLAIQFN